MSVVDVIGHYQRSIEKCSGDPERLLHCMGKLHGLPISVQHLQTTGVGRTVNSLRKYQGAVGEAAKALVLKWKQMVAAEGTSEEEEEEAAPEEDAEDDAEEGDEKDEDEREVEREREGPVENGGSEEEEDEEEEDEEMEEEVEEDGSKNKERAETEEEIDDEDEEEEEVNERNRQVNVRSRTADDEVESKEQLARRDERSNHYHHHHRHKSSHLDKNDGRLKLSDGDHLESKRSNVSSSEKSGHHRSDRSKSREEKDGSRDKSVEKSRHHEHGRSETKEERERRKEKERRKKEGHSEGKEREKKERRDADGHRNKDKRRESREGREGEKERDKHKEMKRQKHEEEMRRQKQEEEERQQEEEEKRQEEERQEEERRRQKEEARKRHKEEEERRQRKEEDKRKQKEEERRHKDEEKRRQKEEERRKQKEEEKRRQEEEKREEEKQNEAEKQRQLEKERRAEKERGREEKKSKDKGGKRKEDRMNGKAEVEKSKCDSTLGKDKDRSKGESSRVSSSEGHSKRDQMPSNLKEEKVGNQAPEDGGVKLKKKRKVLELEDGSIDCGSGASFAEALGMVEPLRSRGAPSSPSKLKKRKKEPSSSKAPLPDSTTSSTSRSIGKSCMSQSVSKPSIAEMAGDGEFSLLSPSAAMRLEPLEVDIAATLPQTVPHYRPLPHPRLDYSPTRGNHHKGMISEEEALFAIMNTKNQRTKVYSGVRSSFTYVPTLYELCIRLLQENIDALGQTGGVPFDLLKPVLERATPQQLLFLEDENPYLVEDTDAIWGFHCQKDFRNRQRQEMETWREMYLRCSDEREAKLKVLTANIQRSMVQSQLPVRRTKLAYVDTVAKPPRNIARTQAKYGTSRVPLKPMIKAVSSGVVSGASSSSQLVVNTPSSSIASAVGATSPISLSSAAASARIGVVASSPNKKPRVAPLMQKTLKFIKGRYKR